MTRVVSPLDAAPTGSASTALAAAGATIVHVALAASGLVVGAHFARRAIEAPPVTQLMDVELPSEPVQPQTERTPIPVAKPTQRNAKPASLASARAAARAGKVLSTTDEVVDFGEPLVQGNDPGYAGGATEEEGSSAQPVPDVAARGGGALPVAVAPPVVDRSRAPKLAGGSAWDCPFPPEADDAGLDHAVVTLRIQVAVDGHAAMVSATRDPGHGFAREARRCALSKHWSAGLDRAGLPIDSTIVVNVRFDR